MKTGTEILSSILKTTQMGQVGIRCASRKVENTKLKEALKSQLREYDIIERQTNELAKTRGWEPKELDKAVKAMAAMVSRTQLSFGFVDSKVAAMMIQGNTRGMIKGLKNLHHYHNKDEEVVALAHKLLDTEKANITQMQGFV